VQITQGVAHAEKLEFINLRNDGVSGLLDGHNFWGLSVVFKRDVRD